MNSEEKVACLPGRRRRRSRFLKTELRERQFYDIIQIAVLFQRNGKLLSDLDPTDERHEETMSSELAVVAATSIHGAKKIIALTGVYENEEAWSFLKTCNGFKVFNETNFTKSYTSLRQGGGTYRLDFLEAFINGPDVDSHEKKLQKRKKLDAISLQFTPEARDKCVTMYFKAMAIFPTLCSFLNVLTDFNDKSIFDVMERYLSPNWTSTERQVRYHENSYHVFMIEGWNLVNEVFKIQVQELCYWKQSMLNSTERASSESGEEPCIAKPDSSTERVTAQDVNQTAHLFCQNLLIEYFAWSSNICKVENVEALIAKGLEALDSMYEKLCVEMGSTGSNVEMSEEKIAALLHQISEGHPTMGDLKYDAATLTPGRRVKKTKGEWRWIPKCVLMRCRWNNTPVMSHYKSFQEEPEETGYYEQVDESLTEEAAPLATQKEAFDEIPETPPPQERTENANTGQKKRARNAIQDDAVNEENIDNREQKRLKTTSSRNCTSSSVMRYSFINDGEGSEIDEVLRPAVGAVNDARTSGTVLRESQIPGTSTSSPQDESTNHEIQSFYQTVVDWPILRIENCKEFNVTHPRNHADMKASSNFINGNARWVEFFTRSRRRFIQKDVTNAQNLKIFQEHWKNILCMEVRGMVMERVNELLPSIVSGKIPGVQNDWTRDIPKESFIHTRVEKVDPVSGIFHLTCKSTNPSINKRIAEQLSGGTLCFVYLKSTGEIDRGCTPLLLAICRRVSWEEEAVENQTSEIDEIELHIVLSRVRVRKRGVWTDDMLHLFQVAPFSPHLRMFKAIQEAYRLPGETLKVLFGPDCPPPQNYSRRLWTEIDTGSADYLSDVRKAGGLNDSQFRSVALIIANIGSCERNSSSVSLVQGPPGTGKSSLLPIIVGAILSHSKVGHLKYSPINALKKFVKDDHLMRCSTNPHGVKFLVCCPSNQAVDNCLEMFHKGVPDGKGGRMKLEMVRLAKGGHDYKELVEYSINEKALPYDRHLFNPDNPERKNASAKAKKAFGRECLIVFCTNSTAGGDRLKSLKCGFDIIIQDEAGQALEPESIIPLAASMKRTSHGRCHAILTGDPSQLSAVSTGSNLVTKVRRWLDFNYAEQTISLFERLQVHNRAAVEFLDEQYRMHPCIADMHSEIFYGGKVRSPSSASNFKSTYNSGWLPKAEGLAPVTLIDTSKLEDRFENNEENGVIMNSVEVNIIDETLDKIKALAGADFEMLRDQISVILPYRSQVSFAKTTLERYGKFRENGVSRHGFGITVNTVDSMQGAERDIIIFAATRSNPLQEVGFLEQSNRLNVAVSRARKLLVIIADLRTMKKCNSFGKFWDYCIQGRNESALLSFPDDKNSRLATVKRLRNATHKPEFA